MTELSEIGEPQIEKKKNIEDCPSLFWENVNTKWEGSETQRWDNLTNSDYKQLDISWL